MNSISSRVNDLSIMKSKKEKWLPMNNSWAYPTVVHSWLFSRLFVLYTSLTKNQSSGKMRRIFFYVYVWGFLANNSLTIVLATLGRIMRKWAKNTSCVKFYYFRVVIRACEDLNIQVTFVIHGKYVLIILHYYRNSE